MDWQWVLEQVLGMYVELDLVLFIKHSFIFFLALTLDGPGNLSDVWKNSIQQRIKSSVSIHAQYPWAEQGGGCYPPSRLFW